MVSTPMTSKISFHVRSNSLPTKPHPLVTQVDEHLRRLRASSETTSSSSSTSQKLIGLHDLYNCVDKLLLLPLTQNIRVQESREELLEGSLRLLDLCDTAKDFLLQTKEFTRLLQSILRRRRSELGFANELRACLISRKTIKKAVQKVLKGMESKGVEKNQENIAIVGLLKEVESVTFEVVKYLLSLVSGSKLPSKRGNWSIVSKLTRSRRVASCDDGESEIMNEIEMVDAALHAITSVNKTTGLSDYSTHIDHLQKFESSLQDFEDSLESVCRALIKIRVSFLNIFNH